jgi:hypothetical protein
LIQKIPKWEKSNGFRKNIFRGDVIAEPVIGYNAYKNELCTPPFTFFESTDGEYQTNTRTMAYMYPEPEAFLRALRETDLGDAHLHDDGHFDDSACPVLQINTGCNVTPGDLTGNISEVIKLTKCALKKCTDVLGPIHFRLVRVMQVSYDVEKWNVVVKIDELDRLTSHLGEAAYTLINKYIFPLHRPYEDGDHTCSYESETTDYIIDAYCLRKLEDFTPSACIDALIHKIEHAKKADDEVIRFWALDKTQFDLDNINRDYFEQLSNFFTPHVRVSFIMNMSQDGGCFGKLLCRLNAFISFAKVKIN